ncbi:MAG: acetyl-CoA hydrolase/transferase family protein [Alphaproteobacteria bacterium]
MAPWPARGDTVAWSHGAAEPLALTGRLVDDAEAPRDLRIFCCVPFSDTIERAVARHPGWRFLGISPFGGLRHAARAGRLDILPIRWSDLPRLVREGALAIDTLLLNVAPCEGNRYSFGTAGDYGAMMMERARTIVAQVNRSMPRTLGPALVDRTWFEGRLAGRIEVDAPPIEVDQGAPGPAETAIAGHVATLVRDGDTLEVGIGSIGEAVWRALADRRDLGVHTGMLTDAVVDLIEAGIVTNRRKEIDEGRTVAGVLFGTRRLYRFADRNEALALHPVDYTHDAPTMAMLSAFVAVNFALQVDLTGQVNSELQGDRMVGAIGGVLDFAEGARRSRGGRTIFALRARTRDGRPAIVPRLDGGVVTVPRSMVDHVVTEHGIATLTGASLDQRAARLAAIAHPDDRAALARAPDAARGEREGT